MSFTRTASGQDFRHAVELPADGKAGRLDGTLTVSYYAKINTGTANGTFQYKYAASALGGGNTQTVTTSDSLTTTWQRFTHTFTNADTVAAGDLSFSMLWSVDTNCTMYITGVQLEVGESATEFEHRPYGTELLLCYRYYYQINSANNSREFLGLCFGYDSDDGFGTFYIPVPMRGSISLSANDISLWLGSTVDSNTISFVLHRQPSIGSTAIPINIDNTGSPAIGSRDCLGYGFNNTSAGYLKFDSEL
jgi:hypothetical protein